VGAKSLPLLGPVATNGTEVACRYYYGFAMNVSTPPLPSTLQLTREPRSNMYAHVLEAPGATRAAAGRGWHCRPCNALPPGLPSALSGRPGFRCGSKRAWKTSGLRPAAGVFPSRAWPSAMARSPALGASPRRSGGPTGTTGGRTGGRPYDRGTMEGGTSESGHPPCSHRRRFPSFVTRTPLTKALSPAIDLPAVYDRAGAPPPLRAPLPPP
jgi:hypothetical protein